MLTSLGRSGVPLYLVYGKGATPKILPQLLTPGLVVQALNGAAGSGG
jgi:thiol:disulfide interchange protein DsbD